MCHTETRRVKLCKPFRVKFWYIFCIFFKRIQLGWLPNLLLYKSSLEQILTFKGRPTLTRESITFLTYLPSMKSWMNKPQYFCKLIRLCMLWLTHTLLSFFPFFFFIFWRRVGLIKAYNTISPEKDTCYNHLITMIWKSNHNLRFYVKIWKTMTILSTNKSVYFTLEPS